MGFFPLDRSQLAAAQITSISAAISTLVLSRFEGDVFAILRHVAAIFGFGKGVFGKGVFPKISIFWRFNINRI